MNTAALIAALLPIIAEYTPQLIADIANLIKGNPQGQAETDAAYITRIGGIIDANATKVATEDAAIQAD